MMPAEDARKWIGRLRDPILEASQTDQSYILLLAISYLIAFSVLLTAANTGQLDATIKVRVYILVCAVLLPIAVVCSLAAQIIKAKSRAGQFFYEPVIVFNLFFSLFGLARLAGLTSPDMPLVAVLLGTLIAANAILIAVSLPGVQRRDQRLAKWGTAAALVILGLLTVLLGQAVGRSPDGAAALPMGAALVAMPPLLYKRIHVLGVLLVAVPLVILVTIIKLGLFAPMGVGLAAGIAAGLTLNTGFAIARRRWVIVWDTTAVIVIAALVFNLDFAYDLFHYNAYLGPLNDVLKGKTLLVDSSSQYGLLSIYFPAVLFSALRLPLSYALFSVYNSLFLIGQFVLAYFLLRATLRSSVLPVLAVVLMILDNLFASAFSPYLFPSDGPQRFIGLYVLLALVALRLKYPTRRRLWLVLEYLAVGVFAVWSLETLLLILSVYLCLIAFEHATAGDPPGRAAMHIAGRAALATGAAAAAFAAANGVTWMRAGQWPDWAIYLQIISSYAHVTNIYGYWPGLAPAWLFVAGIYLISAVAITQRVIFEPERARLKEYMIAAGMTAGGLAQLTYWIANSTIIEAQVIPALFLAAFWLERAMNSKAPEPQRRFIKLTGLVSACLLAAMLIGGPIFSEVTTPTRLLIARALAAGGVDDPIAGWDGRARWSSSPGTHYYYKPAFEEDPETLIPEITGLMQRATPDPDRVLLLVPNDSGVAAFILTHRANVLPFSNPAHDSLSPEIISRANTRIERLHIGDLVVISWNFSLFWPSQQSAVTRLCSQFRLEPVETERDVLVARLMDLQSAEGCDCNASGMACLVAGR